MPWQSISDGGTLGFWDSPPVTYNQVMAISEASEGIERHPAVSVAAAALVVFALVCTVPTMAATVYKTVDENGVVSYSDTPPADDVQVEILEIFSAAPALSESAQEQLEAMRETTDRMVADRQQREQHRAELRKLQAQSEPPTQVIEYATPPSYVGGTYPVYYPYPGYRPGRGHRPRPEHPIARPPLRPGSPGQVPARGVISPGYDYPASLIRRGYSPAVRAAFEN